MSKTSLTARVRALDPAGVAAELDAEPSLLRVVDNRGRSWLHLCCGVDVSARPASAAAAVAIAAGLLDRGLGLDDAAFTEGEWRATPLWYAVGRGRNLDLARFLLEQGCDPNHTLFAAAFNADLAAIDLLLDHGADIDPVTEDETPFFGAVKWSRFPSAWRLASRGADVNFQDSRGRTALHRMLAKRSDLVHLQALAAFGPRVDLPDASGVTAADLLARRRDPGVRDLLRI